MDACRVLHLVDSAGMYGAERVILTLLEEVKSSSYPGILGCIRETDAEVPSVAEEARFIGIPVIYFTMRRGFNPFGIHRILRFIKENNIRIVHSHGYKTNIFLGALFAKKFKTLSTIHGWSKNTAGLKAKLYDFFDVQALKRIDLLMAVSNGIAKDLIHYGVRSDKIKVVHNGLKINKIWPHYNPIEMGEKCSESGGVPILGTLGRLARVKGHENLIRSIPLLLSEFGPCKLVIGGSGSMKCELDKLITELQLENYVQLIGYVKDVWKFLSMIDVFVLPSLSEGLPMSLLEAMAFGKPVVASSVGGIPEAILSPEDGVLIPPGDPMAIARAVAMVLRQPEKMNSIGTSAREVVRSRFSAEVMATKYLEVYKRLSHDT